MFDDVHFWNQGAFFFKNMAHQKYTGCIVHFGQPSGWAMGAVDRTTGRTCMLSTGDEKNWHPDLVESVDEAVEQMQFLGFPLCLIIKPTPLVNA